MQLSTPENRKSIDVIMGDEIWLLKQNLATCANYVLHEVAVLTFTTLA